MSDKLTSDIPYVPSFSVLVIVTVNSSNNFLYPSGSFVSVIFIVSVPSLVISTFSAIVT